MPHIHDLIDYTVDVLIVNGDAVMLRKHDKYKAWLMVGGHVELDEDPTQAAVREAKEEVGLDITLVGEVPTITEDGEYKELLVPEFMNIHPLTPDSKHQHISLVYFATSESRDVVQGETEVSDGIHWFTKEDLDSQEFDLKDTIRYYAKAALTKLGS